MIKAAIEKILQIAEVETFDFNGSSYSTKPLDRIKPHIDKANSIHLQTLSSLVEFVKHTDGMKNQTMICIDGPKEVYLKSNMLADGSRETYAQVEAVVPGIAFNQQFDLEDFNIMLQSKFKTDSKGHKEQLLQVSGNYQEESGVGIADNGVTQGVTIKKGVRMEMVAVPNPVTLKPMRTFTEVEQPESLFIFRMKEGGRAGIFEADGKAWQNEAVENIKAYLKEELKDVEITIVG